MALPMNSTPVYTLTVPSSKKEYKYRPFLVKQEKALLLAFQSEDDKVMTNTLKQIIGECVVDINTNELALFDLEYIFCQLRGKSVGEEIELVAKCDTPECKDKKESKTILKINIMNVPVLTPEEHEKKISLFNDVGVMMKYPSLDLLLKLKKAKVNDGKEDKLDTNVFFEIIIDSIDYIYDGQQIYHSKEQSKEELSEFINNLTTTQFAKIQKFFETMPKLSKEISWQCKSCDKTYVRKLEGLTSFFI
jgi:hypothetical protein